MKTDDDDKNWKFEGEGVMGMSPTSGLMHYLVGITGKSMSAALRYKEANKKNSDSFWNQESYCLFFN